MNNRDGYIELTSDQAERIDDVRQAFLDLFEYIDSHCKSSREISLAMTKLQEAEFWTLEGIAREKLED